jgi:SPP1 gp7 family putative phage head morphogenesis protein
MIATAFHIDPTRTSLQRRSFVAEMGKRFGAVQRAVWHLIANDRVVVNAFDFTDPDKIDHFQKWLQRQINLHILETRTTTGNPSLKKPWLAPRIISAYKIGLARAYTDVKRAGGSPPTAGLNLTPEMKRAMDSAYEAGKLQRHLEAGMAVATRKVELIYTRAYHDLQGITQDMSTKLSRILATGMINGSSPHTIARKMVQQISGISLRRARLIAQTELTSAHASGTLDGLEMQGVRRVTAQVEFQTVGDGRVCPKCKHLEGKRFTIDQARGVIPQHPACRCVWLPV